MANSLPNRPEWHAQELLLLREVMRLVGRSLSPDVVLREMLHLMSELLGLNRGRVVLRDAHGSGDARICHAYGLTRAEVKRGHYRVGEGVTGRVLATGQPLIVQDVDAEPSFLFRAVRRQDLPDETVAFIALPIEVSGITMGVLACHRIRSRQRRLTDDLAVLQILATLAGQLLQLQALVAEQTGRLQAQNERLSKALESRAARYGIVGQSPALLQALDELERVSDSSATVLLLGESGTGKELFARAVHLASGRRDGPFIKVNVAAIPESLFESELFGHDKGAFTGATQARPGWFEQAHGGTIFLDEIGELPLAMQAKLLRTLQEGTLVRLGGQRELKVDVRLVAATHRDLAEEVAAGRFRQDLYYRLNVIPIRLPSLRERREDIRLLALHFISRANQVHQRNVYLSVDALEQLAGLDWPGNIRELGNAIERLVLLADQTLVDAKALPRLLPEVLGRRRAVPGSTVKAQPPAAPPLVRDYRSAASHGVAELKEALERHGGNQSRAAQSLGLTLRQLGYRLRKAGLL
ncbi:sigma-54 interaction domain-containing protein [Tepidicella baoligensis]|uniref:sigma-54 interaction domain-containing protein n=1 Tax=Tepidicella baoligensis TaxID=2707016 RepID=UPI001FE8CDF0|nr:sigma 54-interacting transcriptional regulator [Tepidicella baoligensis]